MSELLDDPIPINFITSLDPGSATEPTIKFSNHATTGMYSASSKEISFTASGSKVFGVNNDNITASKPLVINNADDNITGSSDNIYVYRKSGELYLNNGTETKLGASAPENNIKLACQACSASNIVSLTSGAPNTVDGITLVNKDRVLVVGQSSFALNGIYEVKSVGTGSDGVWARAADFNSSTQMEKGSLVYVLNGTLYGGAMFSLDAVPTLVGMDTIVFTRCSFNEAVEAEFVSSISGTFISSPTTYTYKLSRSGKLVTMRCAETLFTAAFGGNIAFDLQIPVIYRPTTTQTFLVYGFDNNVRSACFLTVGTDGFISIGLVSGVNGLFGNTGNTGINATTVTWSLL